MKLETAYRKIGKHRNRWRITIHLGESQYHVMRAYWKGNTHSEGKLIFPEKLFGPFTDVHANSYWRVGNRGLANAMSAMSEKLDRVELAIQKHNEAQAAIKEAGK